ncbi:MAG: ShlB/FhaC/HecB family hemolysin secretion/activation protein [Thiohalomonadales bacterium]
MAVRIVILPLWGLLSWSLVLQSGIVSADEDMPVPLFSLPIDRPSDKKLEIIPPPKQKAPPTIELPPFELNPNQNPSIQDLFNFVARKFRFEGNTIFSDRVLATLIDKFRLTPINALDLEELRLIITNYYIEHGYINSGALFPDQNLLGGLLIIEITEGVLSEINIENPGRLSTNYIRDRLRFRANAPLNLIRLQQKLQLLQQDLRIERINAALLPGDRLGTSALNITITEAKPYSLSLEINNHRPPSIGEAQAILHAGHNNISGVGDTLDATLNATEGLMGGDIEYSYPMTYFDTRAYVGASRNNIDLVIDPFKEQGFDIKAYTVHTGIRSPLRRKKNESYNVDLKFEYKSYTSDTNIEACNDNTTNIAALRLGQSLVEKSGANNFFLRHTLNVGIDAFNATSCPGNKADSSFTSWLWQLLWAHKFDLYKIQTIARADFQLSQDRLLSGEKFTIGGANSVRGFRENFLVRDAGRFFSIEARLPLRTAAYRKLTMEAMLFGDYGEGWNKVDQKRSAISSIGVGYRWRFQSGFLAELFWARQFEGRSAAQTLNDGWQDDGVHAKIWLELL